MTIVDIEKTLPNGFHDSEIQKIEIDYEGRKVKLEMSIWVGTFESKSEFERERMRNGRLTISGVVVFIIEPPDSNYPYQAGGAINIDSGPADSQRMISKFPASIPGNAFKHFFFVSEWNSFILIAALEASFSWT